MAVLHSGVFVSKELSILQLRQNACTEKTYSCITPSETINGNPNFTCGKRNTKTPLREKFVLRDAVHKGKVQRGCVYMPTSVSTKREPSTEENDIPPSKKPRLIIPIRCDLTDAELTWHVKNIANLLQCDNESARNQSNILKDTSDSTPQVRVIRVKDESTLARLLHETGSDEPALFNTTKNTDPEVSESGDLPFPIRDNLNLTAPEDHQPDLCPSDLEVVEVNELTGVGECARSEPVLQTEVSVVAYPPVPGDAEKRFQDVNQCSHSLCETSQNISTQPIISGKANKHFTTTENSNLAFAEAIAISLDVDECISSNNARSTFSTSEKVRGENFNFRAIAENLDVDECILQNKVPVESNPGYSEGQVFSAMTDECYRAGRRNCEKTPNYVNKQSQLQETGKANNKNCPKTNNFGLGRENGEVDWCVSTNNGGSKFSTSEETHKEMKNFDYRAIAKNLDVDECIRFHNAESRCSINDEIRRKCFVSEESCDSESDIPTLVQEYSAKGFRNPIGVQRHNRKRKLKRKCSRLIKKRPRTQLLIVSPDVTQYSSSTHWTVGELQIRSQPKPFAEEGNLIPQSENSGHICDATPAEDLVSGPLEDKDSSGHSTNDGNESETYFNQQEIDSGSVEHRDGRSTVDNVVTGSISSDSLPSSTLGTDGISTDDCNDNDIPHAASKETNGPSATTHPVTSLTNDPNEKALNGDAILAGELQKNDDQVEECSNSLALDVSSGNLWCLDSENMEAVAASFWSYVQSLVRPEGFPGHPQMKFKCYSCSKLFSCYFDVEGHSVDRHPAVWEKIRYSYLRVLVPYHPGGFLSVHPQFKFKCIFCSRPFTCFSDLEEHLAEIHSGDNPYECPFCFKRFNDVFCYSSHLNEHISQHDFPSYPCNACPACFSSQWELDLHAQTHELRSLKSGC